MGILNVISSGLGSLFIPIMVILIIVAILALFKIIANNYVKVPPNKVAVFYGRKHTIREKDRVITVGFRLVVGGAKVKIPVLESVAWLDLNVFPIDLEVKGAPNKDGVLVNVKGVANVKILSDEISLVAAAERFLGMDHEQIKDIAFKNLEGHLRAIIGRLSVEDIVSNRTIFNQEVLKEAGEDLKKIGLGVDVLTIQEIDDQYGYIKALGQKRTAEVMRDATIGKADADRDAKVRATTASREAEQTANQNLALVAEAEKLRDVKKAQFNAEVRREEALAGQAGPLAEAEARKKVVEAQVEVEKIKTVKEAEVAQAEADRREKALMGEVIKPAEAQKIAAVTKAEGERAAQILSAEANKRKKELDGQGEAEAIKFKGMGEAEAIRAKGLGEADAIKAKGQAEAEVIKLKLLAEAEGLFRKAEAYQKLTDAGQLLQVLEKVREIIPEALTQLAPVMAEIAKPIGNVDRISIVDFGGNTTGNGGLTRFAQTVPAVLTQFFEGLRAMGFDSSTLEKLIKLEPLEKGSKVKENPKTSGRES